MKLIYLFSCTLIYTFYDTTKFELKLIFNSEYYNLYKFFFSTIFYFFIFSIFYNYNDISYKILFLSTLIGITKTLAELCYINSNEKLIKNYQLIDYKSFELILLTLIYSLFYNNLKLIHTMGVIYSTLGLCIVNTFNNLYYYDYILYDKYSLSKPFIPTTIISLKPNILFTMYILLSISSEILLKQFINNNCIISYLFINNSVQVILFYTNIKYNGIETNQYLNIYTGYNDDISTEKYDNKKKLVFNLLLHLFYDFFMLKSYILIDNYGYAKTIIYSSIFGFEYLLTFKYEDYYKNDIKIIGLFFYLLGLYFLIPNYIFLN